MTLPADSLPQASSKRRGLLFGGVAAVAAATGAGVALWKWTPSGSAQLDSSVWALVFDTPSGAQLTMHGLRGRPVLLNFWATWCPPCVEEMPMLDAFYRQNSSKGMQVLGLAVDQPSAVRKFLAGTPVSYPIGMAGMGGTELSKSLGNQSGGLPFTILLSASGQVLQRRMGRLTPSDLADWSKLA